MATILLLGTSTALLEGLSQTLASAGHQSLIARSHEEALDVTAAQRPLLAVVERKLALTDSFRIPLQAGGAVVVYDAEPGVIEPLPPKVSRATLARLVLPLERQRLLALVSHVVERSAQTGRSQSITPTDQRAVT